MPERTRPMGFALERFVLAAVTVAAVVIGQFAACWQSPTTGPGKLHWDRQTCERCQMVISERRHAAQVRMPGKHTTHAFDDLGCALLWLDEQGLGEQGLGEQNHTESDLPYELWLRDPSGAQWIDGRSARFENGLSTPMAYGFGVAEAGISLGVVQDRVREAERRRRSDRLKMPHGENRERD